MLGSGVAAQGRNSGANPAQFRPAARRREPCRGAGVQPPAGLGGAAPRRQPKVPQLLCNTSGRCRSSPRADDRPNASRHARALKSPPPTPFLAALALAAALAASAAASAEPPEREGLACTVTRQSLAEGLRLEIVFANRTAEPVSLPAGPHLVLYRDAAATDAMEVTARIDRLQRTPLVVPAQGSAAGLFGADARQTDELLCNGSTPAAAGLYFYQFSRRPSFRCLLREAPLASLPMKANCVK